MTGSSLGANYFYRVGSHFPVWPSGILSLALSNKGAPLPSFCLLTEPVSAVLFWDVVAGPCRARLYSRPYAASVLPPTQHLPRQWILSESQGSHHCHFTDLVIEQIFVENSPGSRNSIGTGTEQPLGSWGSLGSSGQRGCALCAFVFYSIPRGVL